jgi:hypothetical protein
MKRLRRLLLLLLGYIVLIVLAMAGWAYWRDRAPSNEPIDERVTRSEEFLTNQIIGAAIDSSTQARTKLIDEARTSATQPTSAATNPGFTPYHYTRDAHAKGHGCVRASFTVNKEVNTPYKFGIFADAGKQYNAFIRFSSGNPDTQADAEKDVRGMAIKLWDVLGTKLMPTEEDGMTQDFVLMNNPIFFIRTLAEYAEMNRMLVEGHVYWYFFPPLNILGRTLPYANLMHAHLREMRLAAGAQKARPDSLVTSRFWSGSAYNLGPSQYAKYSAIPCKENKPAGGVDKSNPDYLRLELAKQSEKGGACFDFAVQLQVQGKRMPVEDTTTEWKESDSPFVPLARIVIKPGQNNTEAMNEQCENTAFNPWHSLQDHKPVGVMNRVRKPLYMAMSRFRQQMNCRDSCDTKCNGLKLPDNACLAQDATK